MLAGKARFAVLRLTFFLFLFIIFQTGLVFFARECGVMDEATNRRVSRMIVKSSRVAITRIRAFEAGVAMSVSGWQFSLAAVSNSRPKYLSFSQTRLRISAERSPTPAVNTRASIPLSVAAIAPTVCLTRWT
jgi:hypothetical protein